MNLIVPLSDNPWFLNGSTDAYILADWHYINHRWYISPTVGQAAHFREVTWLFT